MVVRDLERNPWKMLLTMLGLVIGAAAVVAVTSVGLADRDYAVRQLKSLGTNFIWVSYSDPPDASSGRGAGRTARDLNERDFQDIAENAMALVVVTRVVVLYTTIFQGGETHPATLVGADENYAVVRNLTLDEGRSLTTANVQDRRKACLLSHSLAQKLFGRRSPRQSTLRVEDSNFGVVGVFRDIRTPGVETEISGDAVLIPISVARFFSSNTSLDTIYAQARSGAALSQATAQIRQVLARNHERADHYTVNNLT